MLNVSAAAFSRSRRGPTRPACLLPAGLPAAMLPAALELMLVRLREEAVGCAAVAESIAAAWRLPAGLRAVLSALGREADGSGSANSYHNPAHTRDVVVNWANLAVLNNQMAARGDSPATLDSEDLALGLYAALGHDLLHDGIGNFLAPRAAAGGGMERDYLPFKLERVAADRTCAILQASGLEQDFAAPVTDAILTTEPVVGMAALAEAERQYRPAWFVVASMLRDADMLPSIALTAAEHDRQSILLSGEIGIDVTTPDATETLFAQAAEERLNSPSGLLFRPQFTVLRGLNRLRAQDEGWMTLAGAARRVAGA